MKLIIAGTRDAKFSLRELFNEICAMYNNWEDPDAHSITEIVSGNSGNIDKLGEELAQILEIPVTRFPAEWDKYGKAAGPIRNHLMAVYADAALIIRKDKSKGSTDMLEQANERGIPVTLVEI